MGEFAVRTIAKKSEPPCLKQLRAQQYAHAQHKQAQAHPQEPLENYLSSHWSPGLCQPTIQSQLHQEQYGLCAFCTGRIMNTGYQDKKNPSGMRVAHWRPRDQDPSQVYVWSNLLGSCGARQIKGKKVVTCDEAQKNNPLNLHPAQPASKVETKLKFADDGQIQGQGPAAQADVTTLNLNAAELCADRAKIIKSLRIELRRRDSDQNLRRLWEIWTTPDSAGTLPAYAPVAWSYLRKKFRSHRLQDPPPPP